MNHSKNRILGLEWSDVMGLKAKYALLILVFSFFNAFASAPPPIPKIPIPEDLQSEETPSEVPSEEENVIEPPPEVKLNVSPPENEEEAFRRIKDYKMLIEIIPPGTSKETIKKEIFGEYKDLVEPYLEEEEKEDKRDKATDNLLCWSSRCWKNLFSPLYCKGSWKKVCKDFSRRCERRS